MKGIAYGVGVGPGDPELMTLKAVRVIKETEIIAVPGQEPKEALAYQIAVQAVPELAEKTLIAINMPMTKDSEKLQEAHKEGAKLIEEYLEQGKNVVYLTIGDPTIYGTFSYLQPILEADGYRTKLISGVSSFCAATARLNIPLAEWKEPLHIIPATHHSDMALNEPGNYVFMKSASHTADVKRMLVASRKDVFAVENCGLPEEKIYQGAENIPDDLGYFSLIIAKDKKKQKEKIEKREQTEKKEQKLVAYVDGSFHEALGKYAFGCVLLLPNGDVIRECGNGDNPDSVAIRNVAGEMIGAMFAVRWAVVNEFATIELHYDYEGIEKWAVGTWKAKNPLTQKYAAYMKKQQSVIQIRFQKVKAHSGDPYNEEADRLAKTALTEANGIPEIKREIE